MPKSIVIRVICWSSNFNLMLYINFPQQYIEKHLMTIIVYGNIYIFQ